MELGQQDMCFSEWRSPIIVVYVFVSGEIIYHSVICVEITYHRIICLCIFGDFLSSYDIVGLELLGSISYAHAT